MRKENKNISGAEPSLYPLPVRGSQTQCHGTRSLVSDLRGKLSQKSVDSGFQFILINANFEVTIGRPCRNFSAWIQYQESCKVVPGYYLWLYEDKTISPVPWVSFLVRQFDPFPPKKSISSYGRDASHNLKSVDLVPAFRCHRPFLQ
jgi:hypothetical protein